MELGASSSVFTLLRTSEGSDCIKRSEEYVGEVETEPVRLDQFLKAAGSVRACVVLVLMVRENVIHRDTKSLEWQPRANPEEAVSLMAHLWLARLIRPLFHAR